ncbi:MAG TPA: condensation domain-containing protein, partial [Longimicrobiaceae bacterium]
WAAVLGLERVGAHDDFFALGGHSLLATQVVSRLRQAFGVELPLRALFEAPTVAGVAAALRGAQGTAAPPIGRADRSAPLPLSFAQERLWFLDHLEPGSSLYLMPMAVRLRGPLDAAALEWSLGETVRRHEALRTVFAVRGGRAVQVVLPPGDTGLPLDDLAGAPAEAVREAVGAEAWRPFDLERGPLLRARLLLLGAEEHVLVVSMHHVVADAWSTGIFFRELSALYAARLRGEASPLAPLPVQYADYAVWQRAWLSGKVLERQLAWWRERLRGAPPVLELPTDRPRPAVPRCRGDLHRFAVAAETLRPLRALARREGATLYMALLAAWQLLLARWSGQDDVVVGTPVAGRTTEEVEGLVGLFVNTLALRAELWDDPSFRALLARVREAVLGALAHQEVPFEKLVEELQPERSLSHAPVFQVMFSFQNAGGGGLRLPGVALEPVGLELRTEKFDLTLTMWEEGEGVEAALQYATDLFDAATLERMARHLAALLAGVGADPERAVSDVPLLDAAERRALLAAAGTGERFDADATLHALFAEAAARDPHAVAVRLDGESLSYGELEAHADRLARGLRRRGVGPETRVALCAERSVELVVAVLGILGAGGAYVPVDPAYPAERIAYLLEDSGCALVLAQDELRPLLPETGVPVLSLDEASEEGGDVELPEVLPGNAAYVIYTSGSTGRPKGVVVTHANVVRLFRATEHRFGFGEEDVWTLFHSYAFDFSVWEIWGALLYGGRLVVVPFATSRDPEAFRALLARERVTVLSQTPSAFRQLVRADEAAGAADPLALRWVVFGGEALEPRTLLPWLARHGDVAPRLVNMYGITETTVHVTFRPVTLADAEEGRGSAIGQPLPDLRVYVLDRRAEPVPPGVPGEM